MRSNTSFRSVSPSSRGVAPPETRPRIGCCTASSNPSAVVSPLSVTSPRRRPSTGRLSTLDVTLDRPPGNPAPPSPTPALLSRLAQWSRNVYTSRRACQRPTSGSTRLVRTLAVTTGTIGLIGIVGCGEPVKLTGSEESRVAKINLAFAENAVDGREYREVLDGTEWLISLCRKKRDATYRVEYKTVKEVLEDDANTLRQYQPDIGAELDRAVTANCT